MTQNNAILTYLKAGNKLTALEALDRFQVFRLASRINNLRKEGHNIVSTMIDLPNGKRCAEYRLVTIKTDLFDAA